VTTTPCPARQTDAVGAALDCELPAGHEGAHEAHTTPDVTVTWTGGSTTATDPQHARARRRHTIRWLLSLTSLTPAGRADLRTAIEAEQADADEAHARLADYENRLTWETTCGEHARLLDACRAADERAEKADATIGLLQRRLDATRAAVTAARHAALPHSELDRQLRPIEVALDMPSHSPEAEPPRDSVKRAGPPFPMPDGAAEAYGAALPLTRHGDDEPAAPDGAALWAAIRQHAARDHQFWTNLTHNHNRLHGHGATR
jgi:hypothetical protein